MSKLFLKDTPIIGIDISTASIKVMSIDHNKWSVSGYGSLDVDPAKLKDALELHDPSYLTELVSLLLSEKTIGHLPSKRVALSLPTARSYCRTFTLPYAAENTMKEAVLLEAEQYIPIPPSSLYIDFAVVERNRSKKLATVLMCAIPKTVVDNAVTALEAAGLEVVYVEPSISAVSRLLMATEDANLPTIIVDIGPTSTDIAILEKGAIRVTGGIAIGSNAFTLDIAKKLNVTLENAHQLKVLNGLNTGPRQEKLQEALAPSLDKILAETRKVMRYYSERINSDDKLEQLLVVGSGSSMPGIGEYFTNSLVIAARVASPWQRLEFGKIQEPPKQFRPRYLTVTGLATLDPRRIWK